MRFTDKNTGLEFGLLNRCIEATVNNGDITPDDGESLTFFLELVKEALVSRAKMNS